MKPAHIVLIEDNPGDVYLISMALREGSIQHSLTQFPDGAAAVEALCTPETEDAIHPDVILLDLNTPRSDGFEVLTNLRRTPRLAKVPVVILTSSRSNFDRQRALMEGARFMEKPSELHEFLSSVSSVVREMLHAG